MKIKLKEEFINSVIYVPFMNQNILGKLIPEGLYEKMSEKYPQLFERIQDADLSMIVDYEETIEKKIEKPELKKSKKDVIFINDTE